MPRPKPGKAVRGHLARVLDLDAIVDLGAWERNTQAAWERLRDARRALEDETRAGKGGS